MVAVAALLHEDGLCTKMLLQKLRLVGRPSSDGEWQTSLYAGKISGGEWPSSLHEGGSFCKVLSRQVSAVSFVGNEADGALPPMTHPRRIFCKYRSNLSGAVRLICRKSMRA